MNKKGISTIILLIIGIVFFMTAGSIYANFSSFMGAGAREQLCQSTLVLGHAARNGNFFTKEIGSGLVTSPYCATIVKDIKIKGTDEDKVLEQATIAIGSMIRSCWRQFGEGKIENTFGQGPGSIKNFWIPNTENHYFTCYRFKLELEDQTKTIPIEKLIKIDETSPGTLWAYNLQGRKIETNSFSDTIKKLEETGDRRYLSYAGYVFFQGNGHLEFIERYFESEQLAKNFASELFPSGGPSGLIGTGGVVVLALIPGVNLAAATVGGALLALGHLGASVYSAFYDKEALVTGLPLTEIKSDHYYEIRYHAPYMGGKHHENIILNNIKIVPARAGAEASQIEGITLYE
jgi:hypothetical protein